MRGPLGPGPMAGLVATLATLGGASVMLCWNEDLGGCENCLWDSSGVHVVRQPNTNQSRSRATGLAVPFSPMGEASPWSLCVVILFSHMADFAAEGWTHDCVQLVAHLSPLFSRRRGSLEDSGKESDGPVLGHELTFLWLTWGGFCEWRPH